MAITTRKTSIVLDADVIIHFSKGGHFFTLIDIFPEYEYIILDVVYNELHKYSQTRQIVDNAEGWLKKKYQYTNSHLKDNQSKITLY